VSVAVDYLMVSDTLFNLRNGGEKYDIL